jgi:hypothetical protein
MSGQAREENVVTIQQELQLPRAASSAAVSLPVSVGSNSTGGYVISEADYYMIEHILIRLAASDHRCQLARALRVVLRNARPLELVTALADPKGAGL